MKNLHCNQVGLLDFTLRASTRPNLICTCLLEFLEKRWLLCSGTYLEGPLPHCNTIWNKETLVTVTFKNWGYSCSLKNSVLRILQKIRNYVWEIHRVLNSSRNKKVWSQEILQSSCAYLGNRVLGPNWSCRESSVSLVNIWRQLLSWAMRRWGHRSERTDITRTYNNRTLHYDCHPRGSVFVVQVFHQPSYYMNMLFQTMACSRAVLRERVRRTPQQLRGVANVSCSGGSRREFDLHSFAPRDRALLSTLITHALLPA